jgi:hypothetical protein
MSQERGSDRPDEGEPGQPAGGEQATEGARPVGGEPAAAPSVSEAGRADERDPDHWLRKLTAREWVQAGLGELRRASEAYRMRQPRAGHAGARRAAGMALNGALRVAPDESWGRSYMEHLSAVARSAEVPEEVREAARLLVEAPPGGALVALRSASGDERLLEAARTVMAHALAVVVRAEGE